MLIALAKLFSKSLTKYLLMLFVLFSLSFPALAFAHENYVLTKDQIDTGMRDNSLNVFDSLKNSQNLQIAIFVGIGITILIVVYFLFQNSKLGAWLDQKLKKGEPFGHVVLRIALAASFITSSLTNSFLGPEIPTNLLPFGLIIHFSLFFLGVALLVGFLTEIASLLSLIVLIIVTFVYRDYMLTYFNYFGEMIALILYGSRYLSVDRLLFKSRSWAEKIKKYEIPIIRVTYGISVLYPAISIKILHPIIIVEIAKQYNLSQISWLFPPDPLLISLGTGLAQIMVGLFLIVGFETRLSALLTLLLYVGSIIFFKEAVWPHYILLALAFYLVINNGGGFTIDELMGKIFNKKIFQSKSNLIN